MAELRNVCVYCGSNSGSSPAFAAAAKDLGRSIGEAGLRLVYGGGSIGLMGIVAHAVLAHGGPVTGIIPQFLKDREVMLKEVTDLVVTADMHERKRTMFERADGFVALPGGIGTLEEVVEVMTWAQLEQHQKPILFVNIEGFWDPLIAQFDRMTETGFLHKDFLGDHPALPALFCEGVDDVIPTLEKAVADLPQPALDESAHLM